MADKTIIQVKGLGKKYRIMHNERYLALRDKMADSLKKPIALLSGRKNAQVAQEDFWALKDVGFEVKKGEVIGVIGRNGAGKTTLLKIISRITYPTAGEIKLYGRVASLLEVGTGFHSELTGRENVFFNGSILGMKKREIEKKFDQIVSFAEVERFIDTPVKRYSSGMQVRLAFAVAAHLDPEILLVDEVLAVGDLMFQKKCLGKMDEVVNRDGRTILFVSHNMEAVQRLCTRAILLHEGRVTQDGPTQEVLKSYTRISIEEKGEKSWDDAGSAPGDDVVRLLSISVLDKEGRPATDFDVSDPVSISMKYRVFQEGHSIIALFYLYNEMGQNILVSMDNLDPSWKGKKRPQGLYESICRIPGDFLNNGQVSVLAAVITNPNRTHAVLRDILRFNVKDNFDSKGVRSDFAGEWPPAALRPRLEWKIEHRE